MNTIDDFLDSLRSDLFKARGICEALAEMVITDSNGLKDIDPTPLVDATLDYINRALESVSDYELEEFKERRSEDNV